MKKKSENLSANADVYLTVFQERFSGFVISVITLLSDEQIIKSKKLKKFLQILYTFVL